MKHCLGVALFVVSVAIATVGVDSASGPYIAPTVAAVPSPTASPCDVISDIAGENCWVPRGQCRDAYTCWYFRSVHCYGRYSKRPGCPQKPANHVDPTPPPTPTPQPPSYVVIRGMTGRLRAQ